jgi:hypothetical protein
MQFALAPLKNIADVSPRASPREVANYTCEFLPGSIERRVTLLDCFAEPALKPNVWPSRLRLS